MQKMHITFHKLGLILLLLKNNQGKTQKKRKKLIVNLILIFMQFSLLILDLFLIMNVSLMEKKFIESLGRYE